MLGADAMLYGQAAINGLLLGGLYLVIAIGLSLVYGVLNVINVAHGAFVAIGAYATFELQQRFELSPYASIPLVFAILAIVGAGTEILLIRRVRSNLVMAIVSLFALALLIEVLLEIRYSVTARGVDTGLPPEPFEFAGFTIPRAYAVTFVIGILVATALALFLRYTHYGRAIRAVRMDREAAEMVGLRVGAVFTGAFALGAALAGVGGVLAVTQSPATPGMSFYVLLPALVVVTLGGFGSVLGAILAALLYGVLESVATVAFGSGYSPIVALAMLVAVLLVRPRGLLGNRFYD